MTPTAPPFRSPDVAPEGERFLMVKRLATSETQIVTVKNWFDESRAVGSYELGVPRKDRFGSIDDYSLTT